MQLQNETFMEEVSSVWDFITWFMNRFNSILFDSIPSIELVIRFPPPCHKNVNKI